MNAGYNENIIIGFLVIAVIIAALAHYFISTIGDSFLHSLVKELKETNNRLDDIIKLLREK